MKNIQNNLCADLFLTIPGLDQTFYLYREQVGRHITTTDGTDRWYRPTYEAVYFSESVSGADSKSSFRSMTKLIFSSCADENEKPSGAEEILQAIPEDMLQYLIQTLNKRWAVVTLCKDAMGTGFTINHDRSELWEQEESNMEAIYGAIDQELKILGPYCVVENGTADRVPGSPIDGYTVPYKGIFWLVNEELVSVKVPCDPQGKPLEPVTFSLKSGENFDHQTEWEKFPLELTQGKSFDYYPRGRVEIKNCKVTVYCHPKLTQNPYRGMIFREFNTRGVPYTQFVVDGLSYYEAREETE